MGQDLATTQDGKAEAGLSVFKSILDIATVNKPIIEQKVGAALGALALVTVVNSDENDKLANDLLVKCNNTLPVIEGLRKEYTSKIDEIKKSELVLENSLKAEMERVRTLRNAYAQEKAIAIAEANKKIELEKKKAQEIARIKASMVKSVESGIMAKISAGEQSIADLFHKMSLDNFGDAVKLLDFRPVLKPELFDSFFNVDYDKTLIGPKEFTDIVTAAKVHFKYDRCNTEYINEVSKILIDWKAKLPAKKKELEAIAVGDAKAAQIKADAERRAAEDEKARQQELADRQAEIDLKAKAEEQGAIIDSEFAAQIQAQELPQLTGVRKGYSYRFENEDDIIKNFPKVVDILSRAWIHVVTDDSFKGFIKRQKSGFPKVDERGQVMYIDPVQEVLDMLAKVRDSKGNSPEIPGLVRTEEVSTVAKS